jgi:hypothetical protein
MIDNSIPVTHPHHTKLYIVLGVVVVFGVIFFGLRQKAGAPPQDSSAVQTSDEAKPVQTPITLTPEQLRLQQEIKVAPSKPVNLTPEQAAAQKKIIEEMSKPQTN